MIELPIGNYEIEAHSPGEFAEKMNDPYYGGVEKIEIMSGVEKTCNSEMFYSKCQDCYGFYP